MKPEPPNTVTTRFVSWASMGDRSESGSSIILSIPTDYNVIMNAVNLDDAFFEHRIQWFQVDIHSLAQ